MANEEKGETCQNCSYRYEDGFCMQHCYYPSKDHSCKMWTDEPIEFDYGRIYILCQQYIKLCKMYESNEKYKCFKAHYNENLHSYQFFLNCTLNDLHREMSLWKTRK